MSKARGTEVKVIHCKVSATLIVRLGILPSEWDTPVRLLAFR
jgi:hypothetical protein